MYNVEPLLFLFVSDSEGELCAKVDHPFLVRGPICIVGIDGCGKSFFGPVISGDKVMVDETTSSSGVKKSLGVNDLI